MALMLMFILYTATHVGQIGSPTGCEWALKSRACIFICDTE